MTADPFGIAALRRAVVDAWRASPTRLREDANLEEDHARGYYRDRVVVELAQNAADAATRAGIPGRVTFTLDTTRTPVTLRVANVGAPLDADGVASLASLRASSKGEDAVGRFGVGFAAVRSVTDDVTIRSTTGGVRFAATLTRAELASAPVLDQGGSSASARHPGLPDGPRSAEQIAILRLPFPVAGVEGRETVVELVLRDDDAVAAVRAQLDAVDDALLLALPALERVEIEADGVQRVLDGVGDRWVTHRAEGFLTSADVAELPVEQRRTAWSMVWALPRTTSARVPRVLHAPTPTDVALTFPALLVATFPVDPGRRRVLPGAATDRLAVEAGRAYAALLADVAADRGPDVLGLVPTGLPAGELDAAVREAALEALASTALLPAPRVTGNPREPGGVPWPEGSREPGDAPWPEGSRERGGVPWLGDSPEPGGVRWPEEGRADGPVGRVAPRDAVLLAGPVGEDDDVAAVLGTVALPTRYHAVARRLGAQVVPLADALDELASMSPERWRTVYEVLAPHLADPAVREALAGAPVPLADGGVARGARGLVLPPDPAEPVWDASLPGVRFVHPAASHPVLERVGATAFAPDALLDGPQLRAAGLDAAQQLLDGDLEDLPAAQPTDRPGPQGTVDAVLHLAALAVAEQPERPLPFWLGELPVQADDGDLVPVRETALPCTWAAEHLDGLAVVDDAEVARHGEAALRAAGAHSTLDVYLVAEAITPASGEPEDDADPASAAAWLADWSAYLEHLADLWGPDVLLHDVEAIADLDAVAEESWPQALTLISRQPDLRRALLTPVRPGAGARTGATPAPSYAAWWLRQHLGAPFALHDGVPLLPPAPPETRGLDEEVLRALGGVGALAEQWPEDWPVVLDALGPVGTPLAVRDALAVWSGLAATAVAAGPHDRATLLDPLPDRLPALHADDVVVADADDVVVAPGRRWAQLGAVLPAPAAAAAALADLLDLPLAHERHPDDVGRTRPLDPRVVGLDHRLPTTWQQHETLRVDGQEVRFWVADGEAHAVDEEGLADALADLLEVPHLAGVLREALREPERAARLWAAVAWQG